MDEEFHFINIELTINIDVNIVNIVLIMLIMLVMIM